MFKNCCTLLLFLVLSIQLQAQDSLSLNLQRQIGLNITGLLSQTPILPNDGISSGLYSVIFKRASKRKPGQYFRFSVGGRVGIGNFSNTAFQLTIGNERPIVSEGRWHLNYGYDFILFLENSSFAAGVGVGYGPLVAIRFDVSKRISLLTEGSAFLTLSGGPTSGINLTLRPPTGLILVFRF